MISTEAYMDIIALQSIVVAPEAGDWFFALVVDVARKYNVIAPVKKSVLTHLIEKTKGA